MNRKRKFDNTHNLKTSIDNIFRKDLENIENLNKLHQLLKEMYDDVDTETEMQKYSNLMESNVAQFLSAKRINALLNSKDKNLITITFGILEFLQLIFGAKQFEDCLQVVEQFITNHTQQPLKKWELM